MKALKLGHNFATLNSLSPLDGRYAKNATILSNYFSESALMKYRIKVESEWMLHLLSENIIDSSKTRMT